MNSLRPHSIDYIDDERYQWWSQPHLKSIIDRSGVGTVTSMLDVGVGGGHWGTQLAALYNHKIDVVGIDIEPHWVEQSQQAFNDHVPRHCYTASEGDAHHLPYRDSQFDLVTCQTLLMHCHSPNQAIDEMARVVKAGGFLLIAEPMNHINRTLAACCLAAPGTDTTVLQTVWAAYNKGRIIAGHGDENIASILPALLTNHRLLAGVNAYQTEKVRLEQPDETIQGIEAEFEKPEIVTHILQGGATRGQIDEANRTLEEIRRQLQGHTITSPVPLTLFITRKQI